MVDSNELFIVIAIMICAFVSFKTGYELGKERTLHLLLKDMRLAIKEEIKKSSEESED